MNPANRSTAVSVAVFLIRLVWGILFIVHGYHKFTDINKAIEGFTRVGIPLPAIAAPAMGVLELVGGAVLILGITWLTRVLALLLAIEMAVAIAKVTYRSGFIGGYEFDLVLLTGLVAVTLIGPGVLAIIREKSYTARQPIHATP